MNYEVEQKFRITDAAALEAAVQALGAALGAPVEQADQYLNHPARDFAQTDEALRIRSVGEQNWVTYKGPKIDTSTKTRRELELPIEPDTAGAARFVELLKALGFKPVATVRKKRRYAHIPWQGREIELALDDVAGVGHFCELELSAAPADLPAAQAAITGLAVRLGLRDGERRSYLELLLGGSTG